MEGVLHKWTNYMSGWQPRWFVLEGVTLSYYDSQEDAWKGCKGSIKVGVCEIQVHPTDPNRLDLTVPGEQYFYLRAINAAERQKWLVALGTAKACLSDNRSKKEKEIQENTKALKTKMCELRLYCDLLLEQLSSIHKLSPGAAVQEDRAQEEGNAESALLKSTCSTFVKTLEECMMIADRTFNPDNMLKTTHGSSPTAAIKSHKMKPRRHPSNHHQNITHPAKDHLVAPTNYEVSTDQSVNAVGDTVDGPELEKEDEQDNAVKGKERTHNLLQHEKHFTSTLHEGLEGEVLVPHEKGFNQNMMQTKEKEEVCTILNEAQEPIDRVETLRHYAKDSHVDPLP